MGFKFNPFTGELDYFLEQDSPVTIKDNIFWEIRELTAAEITNKQIILEHLPAGPDKVTLDVVGGTSQKPTVDFIVLGNILSWDGLGLEPDLTVGDFLRIGYAI